MSALCLACKSRTMQIMVMIKKSIAKTHLDWTIPLITRKAAKEKQKFTGRKKIQRNSHKEAEFYRTGSKPEIYKNKELPKPKTTPKQTHKKWIFHLISFVPAGKSFPADLFFFFPLHFSLLKRCSRNWGERRVTSPLWMCLTCYINDHEIKYGNTARLSEQEREGIEVTYFKVLDWLN